MKPADDLRARIEKALRSPKVDSYMVHQFEDLLAKNPNIDLTQASVRFLAEGVSNNIQVEGISSRLGNIYVMNVPYAKLPEVIEHEAFLRFEASRPLEWA